MLVSADAEPHSVAAVVAAAGTTNAGIIDDIAGLAEVANGVAFMPPSAWEGQTVTRFAFLHARTSMDLVTTVLDRMAYLTMSTSSDADRVVPRLRAHDIGISSLGWPNSLVRQFDFADDAYEWRRLFAELFGTFLLVFVAVGGPMANARFGGSGIPEAALVVAPGLMVIAIILFMGTCSGAHLNPAVTIGFMLRGDFPYRRVPLYVVAQFAGALLATLVLTGLVGSQGSAGLTLPGPGVSTAIAMAWEAVLTLGLVSVVLGTASGAQQIGPMAAIAVGSYIAVAGLIGVKVSGASMNPARSLGPALVLGDWTSWWAYLAGPLIGAAIAVSVAQVLRGRGGDETSRQAAQGTLGTSWFPGLSITRTRSNRPGPDDHDNGDEPRQPQ